MVFYKVYISVGSRELDSFIIILQMKSVETERKKIVTAAYFVRPIVYVESLSRSQIQPRTFK